MFEYCSRLTDVLFKMIKWNNTFEERDTLKKECKDYEEIVEK